MKSVVFVAQSLVFYRIYVNLYGAEGETRTNLYNPQYKRVLKNSFFNGITNGIFMLYFDNSIKVYITKS